MFARDETAQIVARVFVTDRHGHVRGFQETVGGGVRRSDDAQLEQQGAQRVGGAAGRAHRQQEPIGRGGHVGHGTGGHDRRATAVPVGQLAGTGPRRLPDRARRAADRLQPVAGLRQQSQLATVPRLPDEVSANTRRTTP